MSRLVGVLAQAFFEYALFVALQDGEDIDDDHDVDDFFVFVAHIQLPAVRLGARLSRRMGNHLSGVRPPSIGSLARYADNGLDALP
ncbi:hypothetical protein AO265_30555 [Pseudomonas sp. ABAC61]|nr:hypothetical protein AO265_30555 [Pseudomonas sp. ABAC61]